MDLGGDYGDFSLDPSIVSYPEDEWFLLTPIRKSSQEVELGGIFKDGDGSREQSSSPTPIKKLGEFLTPLKAISEEVLVKSTH